MDAELLVLLETMRRENGAALQQLLETMRRENAETRAELRAHAENLNAETRADLTSHAERLNAETRAHAERLNAETRTDLASHAEKLNAETRAHAERLNTETRTELRSEIAALRTQGDERWTQTVELFERAWAHASQEAEETRALFGAVSEHLTHKLDLVAEGVLLVNEKLDRESTSIRDEMRREFADTRDLIRFSHTHR